MKRLALAAAATVLGACGGSHAPAPVTGSALLYWDFVRNAPAQTGGSVVYDATLTGAGPACPESGVEEVTVDAPGVAQVTLPCIYQGVQGVEISGLLAGTNAVRVRGWRGAHAVYDGSFSVTVQGGNVQPGPSYLDVPAAQAAIEVYAYLFTTDTNQYYTTCASALDPAISYDVWDSFGTLVLSSGVACQDPADPFPVIVRSLDLDNYTIRMQGFDGPTRIFDSCTSEAAKLQSFDHFAAQTGGGGVAITLTTPPACTP